jgi:hypothetical protein
MYRNADLQRLHERRMCDTCGEPILPGHWAYVDHDPPLSWHRSCRAPILIFPEELVEEA